MGGTYRTYVERKNVYRDYFGETRRNDTSWKKKGVGGRIILQRFLKKLGGWTWTGFMQLSLGISGGLL